MTNLNQQTLQLASAPRSLSSSLSSFASKNRGVSGWQMMTDEILTADKYRKDAQKAGALLFCRDKPPWLRAACRTNLLLFISISAPVPCSLQTSREQSADSGRLAARHQLNWSRYWQNKNPAFLLRPSLRLPLQRLKTTELWLVFSTDRKRDAE